MSFEVDPIPLRPGSPAPQWEDEDEEIRAIYSRPGTAAASVFSGDGAEKEASLVSRRIDVLSGAVGDSSLASSGLSASAASPQAHSPSPERADTPAAARPGKKPFAIPIYVDFQSVEKTMEIAVLQQIIDEKPDSLVRFMEILVEYRDNLIPPKYKGALEELALKERAIEALGLPFKEELAQKRLALQQIVLNPENMEEDQEAIQELNEKIKLLDLLFEELVKMTIRQIDKISALSAYIANGENSGELDPLVVQDSIVKSAKKLLKDITAFPLPPERPLDTGHPAYDSAMGSHYMKQIPKYCREFDEALTRVAADEIEEEWDVEFEAFYEANKGDIERDLVCQDAMEAMITSIEAPYVAAEVIDGVFGRAMGIVEERRKKRERFLADLALQAPSAPRGKGQGKGQARDRRASQDI